MTLVMISFIALAIAFILGLIAYCFEKAYVNVCAKSYTIKEGQEKGKPYLMGYKICTAIAIIFTVIGIVLGTYSTNVWLANGCPVETMNG